MAKRLSKQEKKFIEIKAETGNGTLAAKKAFGITKDNNAAVKAHELLRNPKILDAIKEALPNDLLIKVHTEGLNAKTFRYSPEGELVQLDDFATRHKYLHSAYQLRGDYAPEKTLNVNVEIAPTPVMIELASKIDVTEYEETNAGGDISSNGAEARSVGEEVPAQE